MGDSFNLKCHVMDFKVKSQLLPLLFSGGMAAAQAQTVLQQDTHMFREGDVILKQEVQYKSPGRSGKNVVWDFSELTPLENEYRESYDRMDSLFTCSGMNATYQYRFSGDSLLCVGYFNQLLQVRHLLPELIMHYPLTYSDSICSFYYGEEAMRCPVRTDSWTRKTSDNTSPSGKNSIPSSSALRTVSP